MRNLDLANFMQEDKVAALRREREEVSRQIEELRTLLHGMSNEIARLETLDSSARLKVRGLDAKPR